MLSPTPQLMVKAHMVKLMQFSYVSLTCLSITVFMQKKIKCTLKQKTPLQKRLKPPISWKSSQDGLINTQIRNPRHLLP